MEHNSPTANSISIIVGFFACVGRVAVDTEHIKVQYPDVFSLMEHLWFMGESNAVHQRRNYLSKDMFVAVASLYEELYPRNENGMLEATFQVVYMIAWKPDGSQPKAKERGSATVSLADLATRHDGCLAVVVAVATASQLRHVYRPCVFSHCMEMVSTFACTTNAQELGPSRKEHDLNT